MSSSSTNQKRSLNEIENDPSQAKRPRPSQFTSTLSSSSSQPLASSSRASSQPSYPRPTKEVIQLGKHTSLNTREKALRKQQMEEDRLAAKPTISRWDAPPPDPSAPDSKKDKDREKARLKREKDKQDSLQKARNKAEELAKGGKGMMAWVVRKPILDPEG